MQARYDLIQHLSEAHFIAGIPSKIGKEAYVGRREETVA
jgi:hypothetical protein